jgi:hypothetical protein
MHRIDRTRKTFVIMHAIDITRQISVIMHVYSANAVSTSSCLWASSPPYEIAKLYSDITDAERETWHSRVTASPRVPSYGAGINTQPVAICTCSSYFKHSPHIRVTHWCTPDMKTQGGSSRVGCKWGGVKEKKRVESYMRHHRPCSEAAGDHDVMIPCSPCCSAPNLWGATPEGPRQHGFWLSGTLVWKSRVTDINCALQRAVGWSSSRGWLREYRSRVVFEKC